MSELGTIADKAGFHHTGQPVSAVAQVSAHWSSLRVSGDLPRRSALDPQALGSALPHVFLAELVTRRVARLRICGHRIEDLMGMDMRGMPVSVLFEGAARDAVMEAVEQASMGARVILSLESAGGFGCPPLKATLALLPLTDETGQITRLMGVLDRHGDIGRAPRRFTLAQSVADPVARRDVTRPVLRVIQGGKL